MTRVIRLGNGRDVRLGEYVRGIKRAMEDDGQLFRHGLTGWWPVQGWEIVAEFRQGVHDRINQRSGLADTPAVGRHEALYGAIAAGRINRRCQWCGQEFKPKNVNDMCCSDSCRRDYK